MPGQIDSDKAVVRDMFNRFWFCIPAYQRAYVWGTDQISELIDDIMFSSQSSPTSQYFLGSLVMQPSVETFSFLNRQVPFTVYDILVPLHKGFDRLAFFCP